MVLNVCANRITFVRFARNFNRKLMTLIDSTNRTTERNGLYVNYYGYYVSITRLVDTLRELVPFGLASIYSDSLCHIVKILNNYQKAKCF